MLIVMKLMVSGWIIEGALLALCALNQSGKLIKLHERIGEWLKALGPRAAGAPDH